MDGVAMEGPLPPLTKIDDDVEGVEVEVMLALKSIRRTSQLVMPHWSEFLSVAAKFYLSLLKVLSPTTNILTQLRKTRSHLTWVKIICRR